MMENADCNVLVVKPGTHPKDKGTAATPKAESKDMFFVEQVAVDLSEQSS